MATKKTFFCLKDPVLGNVHCALQALAENNRNFAIQIINPKETRMVKDGENLHRLQTTNLGFREMQTMTKSSNKFIYLFTKKQHRDQYGEDILTHLLQSALGIVSNKFLADGLGSITELSHLQL